MSYCYQCDKQVNYLFDDGRCGECTRLTQEEVEGFAFYQEIDETGAGDYE